MAEDNQQAGDGERHKRQRHQFEGAAAALPEAPAIAGQPTCAAQPLHQGGDDVGGPGEAHHSGANQRAHRVGVLGGIFKGSVQQQAYAGRQHPVEEAGELEAHRRSVRQQADDRGGDDERRKERNDGRVSGGLRHVQAIVGQYAEQGTVQRAHEHRVTAQQALHAVATAG